MRFHSGNVFNVFRPYQSKKLKTQKSPISLDLDGKHHDIVTSSFSKAPPSKCFPSTLKRNAGVFKFLQFEERFRDGLVWTVGLQTVEMKLRFEISLA